MNSNLMSTTRERLQGVGATWRELPCLWDVDRPGNLPRLTMIALDASIPPL